MKSDIFVHLASEILYISDAFIHWTAPDKNDTEMPFLPLVLQNLPWLSDEA